MTTDKTPATLDAVRNLIVCDTQFTWAGVTNLTMPQMMDLQARGWVVEGDSNGEFQLTEAGEAVVARALEHGAPATLATVKHGGCVQVLPSDAARNFLAAQYRDDGDKAKAIRINHKSLTDSDRRAMRAIEAALAAQPSPGGQGNALLREVSAQLESLDCGACIGSDAPMEDLHGRIAAHLAARQPGYVQGCDELHARTEGERAAYMEGLEEGKKIATRQPVGQEPVCSGGFVISNGSGEKYMAWGQVGPEWTADRSAALWLVRRADAEALAAENEDAWSILPVERCALPPSGGACTLADGHEGPCPTIAAPPAQAVDLGQLPRAIELLSNVSRTLVDWATEEQQEAIGIVKALIDSQAVGRSFQADVAEWMGQCFLPSLYCNMTERGDRLLEEVLELLQAHGYDKARVPTLVDYVFGRPVGEPAQEVGGVMVTLAGYCWVAGLDMHAAGDAELKRITQPEVMDKIRRKQEAKNALHFDTPLPGHAAPTAQVADLAPGIEAAAKLIQTKADDYADEFGYGEMGGLSFGRGVGAEVKSDHHSCMLELVDELRALTHSQALGK